MERKYLGMDKNVCFGLGYLIPLITLILLITDKELDVEEKRMCVDTLALGILGSILSAVCIGIVLVVFAIIAAVKRFQGDFAWKVPLISKISEAIIK
ncbi:MAG: hypothetical protein J6L23_04755 [Clostridia bacterium]|nr:hypothetical protein [Clostridia bacterium]